MISSASGHIITQYSASDVPLKGEKFNYVYVALILAGDHVIFKVNFGNKLSNIECCVKIKIQFSTDNVSCDQNKNN